jgi:hypothetical protein
MQMSFRKEGKEFRYQVIAYIILGAFAASEHDLVFSGYQSR